MEIQLLLKCNQNTQRMYHLMNARIIETLTTFVKLAAPYFIWTFLHYISSQAYSNYCTPYTFSGYMLSPFVATTPHCRALRWVTFHGGNTIENMWIILGTWAYSKIVM
jgi:hypothetical protein